MMVKWKLEAFFLIPMSKLITKRQLISNHLFWHLKTLKNSHLEQLIMKRMWILNCSQLVWLLLQLEFWKTLPHSMILKPSLLTPLMLLKSLTNGKHQKITQRSLRESSPTWFNLTQMKDWVLLNFGHGSVNMKSTSSQNKNSWSHPFPTESKKKSVS